MIKIFHHSVDIGAEKNPLISILLAQRKSKFPTSDELLLDSSGPITDLSEYSFLPSLDSIRILFIEPDKKSQNKDFSALEGEVLFQSQNPLNILIQELINNKWVTISELYSNNLKDAMDMIKSYEIDYEIKEELPIYPGGFVGLLGYDVNRWVIPLDLRHTPIPGTLLGVLWRAEAWWIHDRELNKLHLICTPDHDWKKIDISKIMRKIKFPKIIERIVPDSESDGEHARKISRIQDSISKGNLYQVNYGRTWKGEMPDHPWNAFLRMKKINPSPFASWLYVHDHGWAVSSASPERLLKTENNIVKTRPIKGTRSRGLNDQLDAKLRLELISSPKELAEHLMLVDLERHDLAPICEPGSVNWSNWRIEALSTVQHLVSGIDGKLSSGKNAGDALVSVFPGGSITGCPKAVTIAAIDELEQKPRGAWTGSIGHIHFKSNKSEWNILIRTLEAHSGPDSWHGTVQAGGGIVIGSIPSEEVEEARWKAASIIEATWGFRTGFSSLPEKEVIMLDVPNMNGPLSDIKPFINNNFNKNGLIYRDENNPKIKQVLLIDNLDSFTENIASSLSILGHNVRIVKGRPQIKSEDPYKIIDYWLKLFEPSHIIIGPGPSKPDKSKITMGIANLAVQGKLKINNMVIPLLGLCLGHQAIGQAVGWNLIQSPLGAVHGQPSLIRHDGLGVYSDLPNPLLLMRYNSLILISTNDRLIETAWDESGTLMMGLRHKVLPIFGIQFHPESVGSPFGNKIIRNFMSRKPITISEKYAENKIN